MNSQAIKQWIYVVLGAFLISVSFVLFISPYHITPGGVYGAGVALHELFPSLDVADLGLILEIPLLIVALILFGKQFGAKTIASAIILPFTMKVMTAYIGGDDPIKMLGGSINLTDDVLLACIFGGIIQGTGVALILKAHATSGGTDIVSMIISKYLHMPISRAMLFVDSTVVLLGLIVFGDWKIPLYSLVTIFVTTKVVDLIIEGGSDDKLVFILSHKKEEIREYILAEMGRGGTYIKSSGMYTHDSKEMIFLVITRREVAIVQDFTRSVDPEAFMVIVNAHETIGDGFKSFTEKVGG